MKVTTAQKVKLGIFVILTAIILIMALYFIGRKQNLFGNTFRITAVFSDVKGLKLGNNVRYAGINIGTVKRIEMMNDSTICVDMFLEESIQKHMKRNAELSVASDGLVGSMVVNIYPGLKGGLPLQEGDTLISRKLVSAGDMMSTLSKTNENAALLSEELLKITEGINEGDGTLGILLRDTSMANNIKSSISNLRSASNAASETIYEIGGLVKEVNNKKNLLNTLIKDTAMVSRFDTITVNLEKTSDDMTLLINNLNQIVLEVKEGKGAFNYLVSDTTLVKNIGETAENIKIGSEMLNENLEAMRHNFFFKGYFKKQEKEEAKAEKEKSKADQ